MKNRTSCNCQSCQDACNHKPGWMKFGDEVILAKFLKLSVKELFEKHLLVVWWNDGEKDYFGLAPNIVGRNPGQMESYDPRGKCKFFEDGKCNIHSASPFECQKYIHTDTREMAVANKEEAAKSWDNDKAKALITGLLGCKPEPVENDGSINIFSMFNY